MTTPGRINLRGDVFLGANGWTAIPATGPGSIRNAAGVHIARGRQNESAQISACTAEMTLDNRDNRWNIRNPLGTWYGLLNQNTPFRVSVPASLGSLPNYLRLEGDQVSYVSTPDSAGLQVTSGTLSVRWDGQLTDFASFNILVSKEGATANAWTLYVNSNGTVTWRHYDGGGTAHTFTSTVTLPYYNARIAIRIDYNITTGVETFFTAPTMAGPWTQLGLLGFGATTQAAGAGQMVQVGNGQANIFGMNGAVYEVQILSGVTVEADPVFSGQAAGTTSFSDGTNTWTMTGTAEISDRLYRFHGELGTLPKAADPSGREASSQAMAYGLFKRLQNSNTPLDSPMKRAYLRQPASINLGAYWPFEDGANAQSMGSALPGGTPLYGVGGTPSLASFSGFACSNPLPIFNGACWIGAVPAMPGTDVSVRFLWAPPAAGENNNALIIGVSCVGGSFGGCALQYQTGGSVAMNVIDHAGNQVYTTGFVSFNINGGLLRAAMELKTNGSGVDVNVAMMQEGASFAQIFTHTLAASTVGDATIIQVGSLGNPMGGSAVGHISIQGTADNLFNLAGPLQAWNGEAAGARVARICSEEGFQCRVVGAPDLSMPMGNQPIDTLAAILQQCEDTDQGMLFEPRQVLGLGYRTRSSMYHQAPVCTASYTAAGISQGFGSNADTQLAVNDVTATAPDGTSIRQVLASGPMSIQAPPAGIGRITTTINPNPQLDSQVLQIAAWYLFVRTVNDDRYPAIPFQMARGPTPDTAAVADIGDLVQLINTPAWLPPPPISQLYAGVSEIIGPQPSWLINVNGIPELPYETAQWAVSQFDTAGSTLTAGITAGATSFQVTTTAGPVWTTAGGNFPFDIVIDGERMTVSAISSTTSPQTFTISARAVNGVSRAHSLGAAVVLYRKPVFSL